MFSTPPGPGQAGGCKRIRACGVRDPAASGRQPWTPALLTPATALPGGPGGLLILASCLSRLPVALGVILRSGPPAATSCRPVLCLGGCCAKAA